MVAIDPESLISGVLPGVSWSDGSRLPDTALVKLTADTVRAARIAAGVHLAFTSTGTYLDLMIEVGPQTSVPAPTLADGFTVWISDTAAHVVEVPASHGTLRIGLPSRAPGDVVRIYLPESVEVRIRAIRADGELTPLSARPRWVIYGDSIAQGWSVVRAGTAWPSLVAQRLGIEAVNLGFAGSARGELLAADVVAASEADCVTLAWGTNAWSSLPTDADAIAATMRTFLRAVRQGLPQAPILVISPILRPDAESVQNRFGTTHSELRTALERAVAEHIRVTGDVHTTLLSGEALVPTEQLADGLHPGVEGHQTYAQAVTPLVAKLLEFER